MYKQILENAKSQIGKRGHKAGLGGVHCGGEGPHWAVVPSKKKKRKNDARCRNPRESYRRDKVSPVSYCYFVLVHFLRLWVRHTQTTCLETTCSGMCVMWSRWRVGITQGQLWRTQLPQYSWVSLSGLVASTRSRRSFGKISTGKCPQIRGTGRPRTWEDIIKMNFWIASYEDVWWIEVDENYVRWHVCF